jgi:hypothetical protein
MSTPPKTLDQANKVVVAFLDGRRLKGYIYDFSPMKDAFNLLPAEKTLQEHGIRVPMKELKAVFFVKEFAGNPSQAEKPQTESHAHGRRIEVSFPDNEKILGKTEGYNPQKPGFFMFPEDSESNNVRIFVLTRNARQVRFV